MNLKEHFNNCFKKNTFLAKIKEEKLENDNIERQI